MKYIEIIQFSFAYSYLGVKALASKEAPIKSLSNLDLPFSDELDPKISSHSAATCANMRLSIWDPCPSHAL